MKKLFLAKIIFRACCRVCRGATILVMPTAPVAVPSCLTGQSIKDSELIPILNQIWVRMQKEPIHDNLPKYAAELLGAMCAAPDAMDYLTCMMSALRPNRDCRLECVNAVRKILTQYTLEPEEKEECDIRPFATKGINTDMVLRSYELRGNIGKSSLFMDVRKSYNDVFAYILKHGVIVQQLLEYTHTPSGYFVYRLFPKGALVAMGASRAQGTVVDLHADARWYDYAGRFEFIVPNDMTAKTGTTKQGKISWRTNANTVKERRYIVVEFDFSDVPNNVALARSAVLALQLFHYIQPCMIVYSGNKSMHCWFSVKGKDLQEQRRFFKIAVELGADPSTWTRCQLVRMPNGMRDNDNAKVQHVLYWNEKAI
jgi:hypothetical protein